MCAHDFFFVTRKKNYSKKWEYMSRVVERQGTNTRAHIDMRALRVFLNNDEKKYKIERVKISQYPGVCV